MAVPSLLTFAYAFPCSVGDQRKTIVEAAAQAVQSQERLCHLVCASGTEHGIYGYFCKRTLRNVCVHLLGLAETSLCACICT